MKVLRVPDEFKREVRQGPSRVAEQLTAAPSLDSSKIVPGYGNRNAKIMFVGEAPAYNEVKTGKPFMGRAGDQFNSLLHDAGIHRDDVYVTNASLRPVSGKKDKFFFQKRGVPSDIFMEGMKAFATDLAEIRPTVVVPLGNYALWMLQQHQAIMSWRGSVLMSDVWKVKCVPTIHPAALLRSSDEPGATEKGGGMWKLRSVVIWDLQRALHESRTPDLVRTHREIIVNPTGQLHDDCVARLFRADKLVTDIESWGGTKLACIGFGDGDPNWAVTWSYDELMERKVLFKGLLERSVPVSGQNLMYDATMLDQNDIHIGNVQYDTMVASYILYPEFPKGLDFLTSVYTDIPYYKDEGKGWKEPKDVAKRQQFFTYNGKDICSTTEVEVKQRAELTERDLWAPFRRKMDIFDPLRWSTFNGMKCNRGKLADAMLEQQTKRDVFQRELDKLAGYPVNVNSPKQMRQLLYEEQGIKPRMKHKKITTDAKALSAIVATTGNRACSLIILVRGARKLISNYYNDNILSRDGRIRYTFNLAGTKFGRLSSSAPLWGPGLNIQNIPHVSREFYEADDGMEFAEFDQVQAEAVITAYLADDPVHIDCFRHGKDVHRVTAALMLDMDPSLWQEIPKDSPTRELAKKCNHGLNYGMHWPTFMAIVNAEHDPDDPNSLVLTPREAKRIHEKYLAIRPALHNYWDGIKRELSQNRTLVSPLGFPYTFLDQWSDTMLRQGYSFKPQSCVGELTNIGIDRVTRDDEMRRMQITFVAQVHDSIIFQWPKEVRQDAMKRIWPLLETELYINGYRVVVPWEGNAGPNWYKRQMEPLGISRKCCEIGYEA